MSHQPRLDLLREALPYIQRFKGKTFVVKLSGKVTEEAENLASLVEELALLHQVGIRVCVVHGGCKQLSELAEQMGLILGPWSGVAQNQLTKHAFDPLFFSIMFGPETLACSLSNLSNSIDRRDEPRDR